MSKYGHVKENIDIITIWVWYKLFGRKGKMAKSHCRLSLEKWPSISARREKGGCVSLSIKPDIVMMRLSMQQWKCYRIASNQTEESQPLKDRPNLEPNALSLASIGKCHGATTTVEPVAHNPPGSPEYQLLVQSSRWAAFYQLFRVGFLLVKSSWKKT